ncbi:hypothetical protein GE09DRAFT_618160 [Coniochaeta sp. 2T2.1]|nr:hypothetical protein GE09DRAFT_618160 [Coniochaeta sp. 2T2.1]
MAKDLHLTSFSRRCLPSLFVLASQVVAATLNAAAKFSETGPEPMHPFMILHIRMLVTGLGCTLRLWHLGSSMSETFFGTPEVHHLVVLRAIAGICSATGFFFSMIYLSLSEATALNFLSPLGSLVLARYLSLGTVQWADCIGAAGALVGVALVAQPERIFGMVKTSSTASVTPDGYLKGLGFGVFGVCGGMVVLTSIRRIGMRAHPLISVNAFAWCLVFVSGVALTMIPGITWPTSPLIWACFIYIGTCGFAMEYLLTVGISTDSSSAATLMIYTQIVWALVVDCAFFQVTPSLWALSGAAIIVGSLCLVTVVGQGRKSGSVYAALMSEGDHAPIPSNDSVCA